MSQEVFAWIEFVHWIRALTARESLPQTAREGGGLGAIR